MCFRNRTSGNDVTDKVPHINAAFATFSGSISVEENHNRLLTLNLYVTLSADVSMCPFLEVES